MPISSWCHFFLFRLEAYHEELNVHEEMFLLTLAVDQDETAEIDREMLNLRISSEQDSDADCRVTNNSVSCKEETSTSIGMIKEKKKKDWCAKLKKVKR